jgi:hypothetical protein
MKGNNMRITNAVKSIGALALMLALATNLALAGSANPNPRVLPPGSTPNDLSYGAWSDAWWTWALSIPADTNPMLDTTGQYGALGQSGPVWFLAGVGFGIGPTVERSLAVPPGKALFFPLVNYVWVNTPEYGDPEWSPEQEAYARGIIGAAIDTAQNLTCQVDGKEITDLMAYRCQTPAGGAEMVTMPDGNVFGIPAGTYGPMVTDGYYLMLTPLTPGEHTIHFTAGLGESVPMDVTYHLTVGK